MDYRVNTVFFNKRKYYFNFYVEKMLGNEIYRRYLNSFTDQNCLETQNTYLNL